MANVINLNAEIGANYIGDDAQPSLAITNTSTGPGLLVDDVVVTSAATISQLNLAVSSIPAGNATVGISLQIPTPSVASGAILKFSGQAYVSAVSLIFAASANWAGMGAFRVVRPDGTFGWVPVLPDGQVTAAIVS